MFFMPSPHYVVPTTMIDVIKHLGIQTDLQLAIDAGDAACYPGSGQTVTDRSGNGNNMVLGNSAGDAVLDPSFVGVAGRQSKDEYFQCTGGGSEASEKISLVGSIPAFFNTIHKQNAIFTIAMWINNDQHDTTNGDLMFSSGESSEPGIVFSYFKTETYGNALGLQQYDDAGGFSAVFTSVVTGSNDVWEFVALSYTESSGAWFVKSNTSEQSGTNAYSASPVNNVTSVTVSMGGAAAAEGRLNSAAVWSRALTSTELTELYNATKAKFGL